MKTKGGNPNSIWNMIPETAEEANWLDAMQHGLTCHDPSCSLCHKLHDEAVAVKCPA
jgi:hypothetical protein